jgi:acyl-CoA reductase-like NAD-dependent aldehyde dehydrogenase
MMSSETVRKIGFTGSTAVGKLLAEQAAKVGGCLE